MQWHHHLFEVTVCHQYLHCSSVVEEISGFCNATVSIPAALRSYYGLSVHTAYNKSVYLLYVGVHQVCSWILLKERLRQRSIRLQSLLVQSRDTCAISIATAPFLHQDLVATLQAWFNGKWQLNKLSGQHQNQPTNCTSLHAWTFIMSITSARQSTKLCID